MSTIKLIDYWAVWCVDLMTPVLTESGYVKASEIKLGQRVLTIDPKTQKQVFKKVKKVQVFNNVVTKKISLETGRELIGDNNHPVLTQEGFKNLSELEVGTPVLVSPVELDQVYQPSTNDLLITTAGNTFADRILSEFGLLPLVSDNSKLMILAKLLGFVITDGYLYEDLKHNTYETDFFIGTEEDALEIKKDLSFLGFEKLEIKRQVKNRQIGERKFVISVLRCRNFNRSLFFLFKSMGSPVGRKKNQSYFVPDWIMKGDLDIKKAFMNGWIGGDGCKIAYFRTHHGLSSHFGGFSVNAIEFHKEKDLESEGVLYAKQLAILFEELGVKVKEVSSGDDSDGVIISIKLATDYQSLLNLAKIGYGYAKTKQSNVPFVREFLAYRLQERNNYQEVKQQVLSQVALGVGNLSIAQNMQIPLHTVVSWKYDRTSMVTHPPYSGEAKFDVWLDDRQQGEFLWEKVAVVEDVEDRDVIGITVDNPHTIVTNGIVSHNCGPCRMMEPVLEEIKKEMGDKLEVVEINVDEHQEEASAKGVMSIPTYIVEKDGKEVGRKVGVTPKAELLRLINM